MPKNYPSLAEVLANPSKYTAGDYLRASNSQAQQVGSSMAFIAKLLDDSEMNYQATLDALRQDNQMRIKAIEDQREAMVKAALEGKRFYKN